MLWSTLQKWSSYLILALHSSKLYRLQQGRRKNNFQICTSGNQQPLPLSPLIDSRRPGHKSKPKFVLCGTQRFSVTLVTHQQWLILVDSLQRMYISSYLHKKKKDKSMKYLTQQDLKGNLLPSLALFFLSFPWRFAILQSMQKATACCTLLPYNSWTRSHQ